MKKILNNSFIHLLVGIAILALLQLNPTLLSVHHFNAGKFNEILNKKELLATQLLHDIEANNDPKILFSQSDKYEAVFKEQGIAFFVMEKNNQVFWTNRSINFSRDLKEFSNENGFIQLKNGGYQYIKKQNNDTIFLALILVKHQFNINNNYLKNRFHASYHIPSSSKISEKEGFPVKSLSGKILFYLEKEVSDSVTTKTNWVIVSLFFIAFLLLISFVSQRIKRTKIRKYNSLVVILFVIISKLLMTYFVFPSGLFQQELFSPNIYAHSLILPSLGDFIITSVFFFIIVFYLSQWIKKIRKNKALGILLMTLSALIPLVLTSWLEGLVKNSKINFDINYLLDLNDYSFAGIFGILLLFIATIVLVKSIFNGFADKIFQQNHFQLFYIGLGIIAIIIGRFFFDLSMLLSLWFLGVLLLFSIKTNTKSIFYKGIFLTLAVSLTLSYGFIHFEKQKESLTKEFWAKKVAKEKDPITTYLFEDVKMKIENDTFLINELINYRIDRDAIDYIEDKYFTGFWSKYNVNILLCDEQDTIIIDEENQEANCIDFFRKKISAEAEDPFQINKDICFLYSADGASSYLGKILIENKLDSISGSLYLYIELYPKTFSKSEGYPELLLNQKEISRSIDLNKYSFAKYKKGKLYSNSGSFNYSIEFDENTEVNNNGFLSMSYEGFNHLVYSPDPFTTVVLSSRKKTIFNYITTFSYLLIITGLLILIIGIVLKVDPFRWQIAFTDFSTKIQLFIIASIFLSFILFGWGTSYYIKKQNLIKNKKNITEKVQSVLIELEHKLGDKTELNEALYDDMTYYLIKFSNVFYTDINLYDKKGQLLASSRPEIFERGLTSNKMDLNAYNQIHLHKKSQFIHNEKIGLLDYLSAYVPFRNEHNEILAYMNLPYFAKQNELENELSAFFTALINIYGLLFLISAIIAVFFANYISEPVRMIRDKIGALQLGKSYDLIDWQSNDEIGSLVSEYNKKVLELEKNALKLAKSERESAWREMAKQVAHEIKNPLTPMKLSIQHLQRTAKDQPADLNDRIDRTAQTLIEQIDTLTNIANEFSNFAKMPKANEQTIDLLPIIETTIDLYKKGHHQLRLENKLLDSIPIVGDKDQMYRVFNNLIKNAIQAIPEDRAGKIDVIIEERDLCFLIEVKDNGIGISEDKKSQIFAPNFTTKTTGMGLGLAMVKNMLENINAKVWFTTVQNKGTSFFVEIPKT